MSKKKVWVLVDSRVGNSNQAIALAQELKLEYELKNILYNNILAFLPNFLLTLRPIHIQLQQLKTLQVSALPDIIIAAGRRLAPLSLYLKQKSNGKIKTIQIMRPAITHAAFDVVILPEHDVQGNIPPNTIKIIGALNNVKEKIAIGKQQLLAHYPLTANFIAVIIGGSSKSYNFDKDDAGSFAGILAKIADNHSLPLFISFSRRTPEIVKEIIRKGFSTGKHLIYDPTVAGNAVNPYFGMLAGADYIIATVDSISMSSEAASTGKPLYIFCPDKFKLKKHIEFLRHLIDCGAARRLENSIEYLENYAYQPLAEAKRVAKLIKDSLHF